jgi:pheromone shutdown-related protein TraB
VKKLRNLTIIGTSHIAKESVEQVRKIIQEYKPAIVALELDQKRLYALLHPAKRRIRISEISKVGIKGFLFNLLGAWAEKKMGKMVATPPGSEMKQAMASAREVNARIALIDQDIHITLKRLSETLTLKEKWRFVKEVAISVFGKRQELKFDLRKVPEQAMIKKLTAKIRKEYPSLYKVLIEERNEVMAKALYKIMNEVKKEKIVAVIGAGHEEEIIRLIKKREKDGAIF